MTGPSDRPAPVTPEELSAFIDGELPADRTESVEAALLSDPALAARAEAFRSDRDRLRAAWAPVAQEPLPAAWLARIEAAAATSEGQATPARQDGGSNVIAFRPRPAAEAGKRAAMTTLWRVAPWAAAACLVLALATPQIRHLMPHGPAYPSGDAILREALSARADGVTARETLSDGALPAAAAQGVLLRNATGLAVHAPDLRRLGWSLAALKTYPGAAELRYRNKDGAPLTLYVRRSDGTARFDLLREGKLRVCIWQDDVVAAVIVADMPAGPMMRVAVAAYNDLSI